METVTVCITEMDKRSVESQVEKLYDAGICSCQS